MINKNYYSQVKTNCLNNNMDKIKEQNNSKKEISFDQTKSSHSDKIERGNNIKILSNSNLIETKNIISGIKKDKSKNTSLIKNSSLKKNIKSTHRLNDLRTSNNEIISSKRENKVRNRYSSNNEIQNLEIFLKKEKKKKIENKEVKEPKIKINNIENYIKKQNMILLGQTNIDYKKFKKNEIKRIQQYNEKANFYNTKNIKPNKIKKNILKPKEENLIKINKEPLYINTKIKRNISIQNKEKLYSKIDSPKNISKKNLNNVTNYPIVKEKEVKKIEKKKKNYDINDKYKIIKLLHNDNSLNKKRLELRKKMKDLKKQTENKDYKIVDDDEEVFLKEYEILEKLGQGSYAKVKLAKRISDGVLVAIKIYDKVKFSDKIKLKNLKNEINIMKMIDHNNIIKFYDYIESTRHYFIIMEYIGKKSLYDLIGLGYLKENDCKPIFYKILQSLDYLHEKNIIHRDIKLENILISENYKEIKLIDFGFSIRVKVNGKLHLFCGTPCYLAPEIIQKKPYNGQNIDIWALGVCFYKILTGKFPFNGTNERELYIKIKNGSFEKPKNLSQECQNFLKKFWVLNPADRSSAKDLLNCEWFNN